MAAVAYPGHLWELQHQRVRPLLIHPNDMLPCIEHKTVSWLMHISMVTIKAGQKSPRCQDHENCYLEK